MSEASGPPPTDAGGLQFDRAEAKGAEPQQRPGVPCAGCKRTILDAYFEVRGKTVCARCREVILHSVTGGSAGKRFALATLFGIGAGVLGAGLYYAVLAITGYELGLVAIVVGLLVGSAVRKGSEGRGGWPYQLLAACITYCAIVSTYVPFILKELHKSRPSNADGAGPTGKGAAGGATAAPAGDTPEAEDRPIVHAGKLLLGLLLSFARAFAMPIRAGFQNFMIWIIIGIALYEAWRLNQHIPLVFTGPFRVSTAATPQGSPSGG
ncbi:MAG: hypothetical protein HYZ53_21760 [Planctomycetes bacterium]|nr:hypothetical protein [Planctomycetota bacterium]